MESTIRMALNALQTAGTSLMRHFDHLQPGHHKTPQEISDKIHHMVLDNCAFILEKNKQHTPLFMAGDEDARKEKAWILLPIEGLPLYQRQIPEFCMVLQLRKQRETHAVVVYNPIHHQYASAVKGQGAYGDDHRLRIQAPRSERLMIGVVQSDDTGLCLPTLEAISQAGHDFYCLPSLSTLVAHVASGKLDGVIAHEITHYQSHGAQLLLREAGALMTNLQGEPSGFEKGFVAGHAKTLKAMVGFTKA